MKVKVRLDYNSYLMNCTIIKILERVRKEDEAANYDLVEVECDNWKNIRQVFFDGSIATPQEIEGDKITLWNVDDIETDIEQIKKALDIEEQLATHEGEKILYTIQGIVNEMLKKFSD